MTGPRTENLADDERARERALDRRVARAMATRRAFLAGAAGTVLLAACGSSGSDDAGGKGGTSDPADGSGTGGDGDGGDGGAGEAPAEAPVLVSFIPPSTLAAGTAQRLAMGIASSEGALLLDGLPKTLDFEVEPLDGGDAVTVSSPLRAEGLPRGYYAPVLDGLDAGRYQVRAEIDGSPLELVFEVVPADAVTVPGPSAAMVSMPTATTDDPLDLDPICTRRPDPCPFHDVSLDDALASGKPIVYFVGTPAFCSTAICGPTLEVLIDVVGENDDLVVIHQEVYTDDTASVVAEAVTSLGLTYEPSLFLIGSDGAVSQRLDVIFDVGELNAALAELA